MRYLGLKTNFSFGSKIQVNFEFYHRHLFFQFMAFLCIYNPHLFYTLLVPEPVPQLSTPKQEPEQNLKISKLSHS